MINPNPAQGLLPLTGKISCTVVQAYWVITKSLQSFLTRSANICKKNLVFQVESKADFGWKSHSCAFVCVLEEYTRPLRAGDWFRILSLLIRLWMCCTLSTRRWLCLLRSLSKLRKLVVLTLQRWKLSTNAACSLKFYMSYTLLQYWVDWQLCLSVRLAPSHSPCARRHAIFLAHPATWRRSIRSEVSFQSSQQFCF